MASKLYGVNATIIIFVFVLLYGWVVEFHLEHNRRNVLKMDLCFNGSQCEKGKRSILRERFMTNRECWIPAMV